MHRNGLFWLVLALRQATVTLLFSHYERMHTAFCFLALIETLKAVPSSKSTNRFNFHLKST